mgnify:CR=1 FL=1|jgi:hypothetical protein
MSSCKCIAKHSDTYFCDCECHYDGLKCMCTRENCEYEHE